MKFKLILITIVTIVLCSCGSTKLGICIPSRNPELIETTTMPVKAGYNWTYKVSTQTGSFDTSWTFKMSIGNLDTIFYDTEKGSIPVPAYPYSADDVLFGSLIKDSYYIKCDNEVLDVNCDSIKKKHIIHMNTIPEQFDSNWTDARDPEIKWVGPVRFISRFGFLTCRVLEQPFPKDMVKEYVEHGADASLFKNPYIRIFYSKGIGLVKVEMYQPGNQLVLKAEIQDYSFKKK